MNRKKKGIIVIIMLVLLFAVPACGPDPYIGWQTIYMDELGNLKIPEEWVYTEKDGKLYFTDKPMDQEGYKFYLLSGEWKIIETEIYSFTSEYIGTIILEVSSLGQSFSNSARYIQYKYTNSEGVEQFLYGMSFTGVNLNNKSFIAWDNLIDKETLIKIAESYDMDTSIQIK